MTELNQVYKCNVCGNIIEVLHSSSGTLVCCGQPMEQLNEKTEDQGLEKHVPVIEKIDSGVKVKVGAIPHPMEPDHYIEWVELLVDDKSYRQFLKPSNQPEIVFDLKVSEEKNISAREYCNLHGLWKS